ncbi:hypothetical protein ACRAWD_16660 [Caulobacter segnis]
MKRPPCWNDRGPGRRSAPRRRRLRRRKAGVHRPGPRRFVVDASGWRPVYGAAGEEGL